MSFGKVPMKAGGGVKWSVSLGRGTQVSKASQRAATTSRHCHRDKLSGDMYLPTSILTKGSQEGQKGEGQTAT